MAVAPDERIAALEARLANQDAWLHSIDRKLDEVIATMNMGKGAWFAMLKLGGILVVLAAAVAWIAEKVHLWK